MKPSTNSHPLSLDDDDDVELEEMFGFRAKIESTTTSSISNNAATVIKANNNISGSKGRVTFESWKENMEEDISRQNNDTDGNQFINIEPAVKIIRLDEITDADVDDLEKQLFQKYLEVEDIRDDMDVELEPKEKSSVNNDEDEEGEQNYYDVYEADEEEEGMLQYIFL